MGIGGFLFEPDCTRENALKAWDKVFYTDFFSARLEEEEAAKASDESTWVSTATGLTATILTGRPENEREEPDRPVDKRGGGRYA